MRKTLLTLASALLLAVSMSVLASNEKPHVYINPGHGGHSSDDRNVPVPPFERGDTMGFWESNASLWKGFALQEVLRKKGYTTSISRVKNDEEDDLNLSTIVALCNQSGADVFYAIHSNATGQGEAYRINFPMGIYRGYTGQPQIAGSDSLCATLGPWLMANQSTVWTRDSYQITGDWTFYPGWGTQGLGVLRGNRAVSMLDEGSFHDYTPETYRLINRDYDWVEGWNFSLGADTYFKRDNYDLGIVTGNIRDDRMLRTNILVMVGADARRPVNGCWARLIDQNGAVIDSCQTDSIENGIYLFKYVKPGNYKVQVSDAEHFGQTKDITVNANRVTYCNFDLKRVRNTPPQVVKHSPVWNEGDEAVRSNVPVVLDFNWDMDSASVAQAFSVTPACEGTITWEDSHYRLVFRPTDAWATNTNYTVTLAKTAQHGGGTPMDSDFVMHFTTEDRNHIYQLAVFPAEGDQVHYKAGQYVEFRTDSLLEPFELVNRFHVYDKDGNELAFNKRSVRSNKRGDAYGYCRLPLLKALTPGEEYHFVVDQATCDTVGYHLPKGIDNKFTAVDAGAEKAGLTIDDFESATGFTASETAGSNAATCKLSKATDRLQGTGALQVAYTFENDGTDGLIEIAKDQPDTVKIYNGSSLGLHINGDMSYNTLSVTLKGLFDGDLRQVPVGQVTWHGWRYVEVKLDALPQGQPYQFAGLSIAKNGTVMGRSGTLKIDNLLLAKASGIDQVLANGGNSSVCVMPNPASDYVVASADGFIQGVELFSNTGALVARNAANYVNVSQVPNGVYYLRVVVGGNATTRKVIVKH